MYTRLIKQRWTIYAVIHDEQVTPTSQRNFDLKTDQWDLLDQLVHVVVLKPLQIATTAFSFVLDISMKASRMLNLLK